MLSRAYLSSHFLLLCLSLLAAAPAAVVTQAATPDDFYGFWQLQEPAGDKCVVNIKRAGRASCFFMGSASSKMAKGQWIIDGERLVVTWESNYRDVFSKGESGVMERQAFRPDQSLSGAPAYVTRADKLDPRLPGSLTIERDLNGPPSGGPSVPPIEAPTNAPPLRNPFIGYWMVEQSPGLFFGLLGSGEDRFFLFLDRNGQASMALRKGYDDEALRGTWAFVDGQARITWPSQRKDALVKNPDGGFQLLTFGRKGSFNDRPNERREVRQSSANEASQYFNSGDVRLLTMTDIRGLWAPLDPNYGDQSRVNILGWGNALLETAETGELISRGTWKLFNDHFVITWENGTTDVIRNNLRFWVRERFAANQPIAGAPLYSIRVTKIANGSDR